LARLLIVILTAPEVTTSNRLLAISSSHSRRAVKVLSVGRVT
jgi:hypothetical protein